MERRPEVVLVSFGSIAQANLMPRKMKQAFLHAFDQFPNVTFVWKYENDDDHVAEGHDNVVTGKWLPQNEILGEFISKFANAIRQQQIVLHFRSLSEEQLINENLVQS